MKFEKNLNVMDSGIRMVVGFIFINLTTMGFMNGLGLFLGTLLFATAYFQHCPFFAIFQKNRSLEGAEVEQAH